MEKNMEEEMETGVTIGYIGVNHTPFSNKRKLIRGMYSCSSSCLSKSSVQPLEEVSSFSRSRRPEGEV